MGLIIVIMYILCNLPRLALNLSEYLLQAELYAADTCGCFLSPVWFSVMCSLNHFLLTFNSSTNFLIYWSVGGSPKKCFLNIIKVFNFPIQKLHLQYFNIILRICYIIHESS